MGEKVIRTNIASNYVPNWGYKEGVREIVQNALDSHDCGHQMNVTYQRKKNSLFISNKKVTLEHRNLLLGGGDKADNPELRGRHSEGMKIGILALIRSGMQVSFHNGGAGERWDFSIEEHPEFNEDVLTFKILEKNSIFQNKNLVIEIKGMKPKEWREAKDNFLSFGEPIEPQHVLRTPHGRVLTTNEHKGRIYSGGIYVTTDKDLTYGYDFNPKDLELNRDRDMVYSWDLYWATSKMWGFLSANKKGKLYDVKRLLKEGAVDVSYMDRLSDYNLSGQIAQAFIEEHGESAYPVTSEEQAKEARNIGRKPVYSSSSYAGSITKTLGTIEDLKIKMTMSWEVFHNIRPIDDANVRWAMETFHKVFHNFKYEIEIVKFAIDSTKSVYENGTLAINHNLISDKYEILRLIVKACAENHKDSDNQSILWKKLFKQTVDGLESQD